MLFSVYQFTAGCNGSAGGIVFAKVNPLEICEEYIGNACVMPSMKSDLAKGNWNFETICGMFIFSSLLNRSQLMNFGLIS